MQAEPGIAGTRPGGAEDRQYLLQPGWKRYLGADTSGAGRDTEAGLSMDMPADLFCVFPDSGMWQKYTAVKQYRQIFPAE